MGRDEANGKDNNDKHDYNEVQSGEEKMSLQNCHKRILGAWVATWILRGTFALPQWDSWAVLSLKLQATFRPKPLLQVTVKGKVRPRTGHESPEGSRRIALLFVQPRC